MIDMNKEIVFKDGWTLDGDKFDDFLKARALVVIAMGYNYGLKLEDFYYNSELVYFRWRGTKKSMEAWYTDYSISITCEPEERRNAAIEVIRNK